MLKIILCIFIIHYLEYLWKTFEEPIVYLIIRPCNHPSSIRAFFLEQYEKIRAFIFNSKKHEECQLYQINLHLSLLFFIFKYSSIFYCLILLFKILIWFYEKQCYYILRKQIKPFVHIRSVALISQP